MSQMMPNRATQPPHPTLRAGPPSPPPAFENLRADPANQFNPPSPKTARSKIYVASWALIALAAAAYVTVVLAKPNFIGDWFPGLEQFIAQLNTTDRPPEQADAARLRDNLRDSQAEVSRLRNLLADREAEVKTAELRIAGLEKDLVAERANGAKQAPMETPQPDDSSPVHASAATDQPQSGQRTLANSIGAPTPHGASGQESPRPFELVNARPQNAAPTTITTASTLARLEAAESNVDLPLPSRRPKPPPRRVSAVTPAPQQPATRIETGSVAAAPVTFGAPVVTHQSEGNVGVRLTAGPSVDALRLSWSLMSERYSSVLAGLQPRYVTDGAPAAPYALLAGPLRSSQEAQSVCGSLIAKGIPCSVDSFKGNAL